ncbi:MAG TPA: hypothetical protein VKS01_10575, partial [Bryobacteraceae bacterium]|nr:hypothetical protein [Bryobacteraceae bacterium]
MIRTPHVHLLAAVFVCAIAAAPAIQAQGTLADYQRAQGLQAKARGLVVNSPGAMTWVGDSATFWYPKSVKGGTEFEMVDAASATKAPAFDHDRLATAISSVTGHGYTGLTLPFAPSQGGRGGGGRGAAATSAPLTFSEDRRSIQFGVAGSMYKCTLDDYKCSKGGAITAPAGRGGAGPEDESLSPEGPGGDPVDGLEYQPPPQQGSGAAGFGRGQAGCAPRPQSRNQARGARGNV